MHEALGVAHRALAPDVGEKDDPAVAHAREDVDRFIEELGWEVSKDAPGRHELAVALATLRRVGWPRAHTRLFTPYARAALRRLAQEHRSAARLGSPRRRGRTRRARRDPGGRS
jgi:hypothetical protein